MGRDTSTREAFAGARRSFVADEGPATARAEQKAKATGKLHPLVDPAGYGVIRRSLPRFEQLPDGLWQLTIGVPVPIETTVDTTGSMGGNVDIALRVLPDLYELCRAVLPGRDPQIATGIFGDVGDPFVLCRPQFEMVADKLTEQLTLMVPERAGGDRDEDPHYALFGAAYLTDAYLVRAGFKSYHFTASDAPARDYLDEGQLIRIFGSEVFAKVKENGHQVNRHHLPTTKEVVDYLLTRAHAFFLQVGNESDTKKFWTDLFGRERVVVLPGTELLPQVQSAIIGLTEGTLSLRNLPEFLAKHNVKGADAQSIMRSVTNIPIGAQAALPRYAELPKAGDLFREKTDLWPVDPSELKAGAAAKPGKKPGKDGGKVNWL